MAPLPQPPRPLHGVKPKVPSTERALFPVEKVSKVVSPNTYESMMFLPVSTPAAGVRAPSQQRIGREKAAETHRSLRGMPTNVVRSPETAV